MDKRERVFDMFKILIKENMTIGGQFSDLEIDAFARNAYQIVEQFDSTFSELEQENKEMD